MAEFVRLDLQPCLLGRGGRGGALPNATAEAAIEGLTRALSWVISTRWGRLDSGFAERSLTQLTAAILPGRARPLAPESSGDGCRNPG